MPNFELVRDIIYTWHLCMFDSNQLPNETLRGLTRYRNNALFVANWAIASVTLTQLYSFSHLSKIWSLLNRQTDKRTTDKQWPEKITLSSRFRLTKMSWILSKTGYKVLYRDLSFKRCKFFVFWFVFRVCSFSILSKFCRKTITLFKSISRRCSNCIMFCYCIKSIFFGKLSNTFWNIAKPHSTL